MKHQAANVERQTSDANGHPPSGLEARVLWVLTIVLALVGQQVLTPSHDDDLALGLLLFALAALGLLALMGRAERLEPPEKPLPPAAGQRFPRTMWFIVGLALGETFIVLMLLQGRRWDTPCGDAFILWGASIVLLLLGSFAAAEHWPSRREVMGGLSTHRLELLVLIGLTLAGLVLRAAALDTVPATLSGDEGSQGMEALRFLDGRLQNMFVTGWLGVPTMSFLAQATTIRLFGADVFGLRILWAVVGTVTLPILYALTRQLFDRRTALIATAFLAVYHYHIHYSRLGSNQVADALFLTAALAALVWGLHRNSPLAFGLSGVVAGLGMYFYAGARLVPVALIGVLTLVILTTPRLYDPGQPGWRVPWRHLALLALGFLVAAAPMLMLAVQRPDEFNARINMVGIIQSGWLEREPGLTGKPLETILAEQFLKSVLAFNHYWDRVSWYGLRAPLLDLVAGALAVLGLVYALAHWKQRRYAIPALWVGLIIVFGAFLTENPPSSQRLVGAAPALAILVAVGLVRLADLGRDLWSSMRLRPAWWNAALALVIGLLAARNLNLYFVEYIPTHIYGNPNAQAATALGYHLRNHPADRIVYFFGPPRIYFGFGSIGYLAPGAVGVDVHEPLTGPPGFVDPDHDALFVFLPERLSERTWVEQSHPGGTWQVIPDHLGQMMLALYEVPRK